MKKISTIPIIAATLVIFAGSVIGCFDKEDRTSKTREQTGSLKAGQKLIAKRIQIGKIPEAMQWKKAAVFAFTGENQQELLDYLNDIPAGLDSTRTVYWEPSEGLTPSIYLLYGWSNSGTDELRRASLDSVMVNGNTIKVFASRPFVHVDGHLAGTADMKFHGWEIPLRKLDSTSWQVELYVQRDTIEITTKPFSQVETKGEGYKMVSVINCTWEENK